MSLKVFHIIFIAISILTAVGFGMWCLYSYNANTGSIYLIGAFSSFIVGAGLVLYGIWFLRKIKNVSSS